MDMHKNAPERVQSAQSPQGQSPKSGARLALWCLLDFSRCSRYMQPLFEPRPHRLEAQDTALSRRRRGFESRWGRQ